MNNLTTKCLINIIDCLSVLCNPDIDEIINNNLSDLSVIYFTNNLVNNNSINSLLNTDLNKVLVVSNCKNKDKNKFKNKKITFCSHINLSILKSLKKNIVIILDINNNYDFLKFTIKNFNRLLEISPKLNINLCHSFYNSSVICTIISNDSIYLNDVLNCIKATLIDNRSLQYEFIYDTVCDYLDSQFHNCNLCDFKNDQCIANRAKKTVHQDMGCCYSFTYGGLFDFRIVKNVKLCQYMQNRTCATKNITCKLFTCKYLKEKNIKFDTHKILLLDCFFNKKQHNIIQSNFFRTREEILQKLQDKNHDLYFWYILKQKYIIKG